MQGLNLKRKNGGERIFQMAVELENLKGINSLNGTIALIEKDIRSNIKLLEEEDNLDAFTSSEEKELIRKIPRKN